MKKTFKILFVVFLVLFIAGCGKTEYCCREGYKLSGDQCIQQEKFKVKITYTCPNGYIAKKNGVCYRSDGTRAMYASESRSCPHGKLVGNECIETYYAAPFACEKEK